MKTKKVKKIMSLFLAALMCVTTLAGFGTTAYAAEETDEVYYLLWKLYFYAKGEVCLFGVPAKS